MKSRGLQVIEASAEFEADWLEAAEVMFPMIRERLVPAPVFDRVIRLRDEFRAAHE